MRSHLSRSFPKNQNAVRSGCTEHLQKNLHGYQVTGVTESLTQTDWYQLQLSVSGQLVVTLLRQRKLLRGVRAGRQRGTQELAGAHAALEFQSSRADTLSSLSPCLARGGAVEEGWGGGEGGGGGAISGDRPRLVSSSRQL